LSTSDLPTGRCPLAFARNTPLDALAIPCDAARVPRPRTTLLLACSAALAAFAALAGWSLVTCATTSSAPSSPSSTDLTAPLPHPAAPKLHEFPVTHADGTAPPGAFSDTRRGPGGERGFEWRVRPDYFLGLRGDLDALARVERLCDQTLAADPNHAEAMAWKGSVLAVRSGRAYRTLAIGTGRRLWDESVKTLARARALEPQNSTVTLARGQCLIHMAGFHLDRRVRRELTALGVQDLLEAWPLIAPHFDQWAPAEKGEYWTALAAGYDRLGQSQQARELFTRVRTELPGTTHAQRAQDWLNADR